MSPLSGPYFSILVTNNNPGEITSKVVEFTLLRHLLISHLPAKARSSRFLSLKRKTNREGIAGVVGFLGLAWKSYKKTAPASEQREGGE